MLTDVKIEKLDELLRPHLGPNEEIAEYHTKAHTAPGENFGSQMISLDVNITDKKTQQRRVLQLVNKMVPPDPFIQDMFNTKVTYIKEMDFYLKAVPAMLKLQQDYKVPEKDWITNIVPKCFGARIGFGDKVDSDAAILLENLGPRGYSLKNKKTGLDFNHARLVLEKLAYIHALPIALRKKRSVEYENGILPVAKFFTMNEDGKKKKEMKKKFFEVTREVFRKLPIKTELIERAIETTRDMNFGDVSTSNEPFLTFIHDDMWVNNLLFLPDSQNPDLPAAMSIVDFQTTCMHSPLRDVIFFLYTSVTPSVRKNHYDELIDVYHNNFCKCLRQVQCDTSEFSKEAVLAEIDNIAKDRLWTIFGRLRIIMAHKDELVGEDWYLNIDLGGEEYLKRLTDVVLDFGEREWLKK